MSRRFLAVFIVAVVGLLGLAACGGGAGGSSDAKDASTIKIEGSPLGDILVDGNGHTLYLFTVDGDDASASRCVGKCQELWPRVKGKPKAGDGVDPSLIGSTTGDNAPQATYAGHPLYYYDKDGSDGEVTGQGVGKVWYVLDGKGAAITKMPATSSGGGGY
ncbi:MAG: hypothetical protein M3Q98_08215 [Actinomycetota bacterium]|nr:hypothetical protein [Actinomycetota bacterium]